MSLASGSVHAMAPGCVHCELH